MRVTSRWPGSESFGWEQTYHKVHVGERRSGSAHRRVIPCVQGSDAISAVAAPPRPNSLPAMGVTARRELPPTRLGAYALRALLRAKAASRSDSVIQHVRQMPYMFCWPSPVAMINCKHSVCEQL